MQTRSTNSPGIDPTPVSRDIHIGYETFLSTGMATEAVRPLVVESWRRSMSTGVDPDGVEPRIELVGDQLDELRWRHPLASTVPLIRRLLVEDATDDGLLIAITDARGRLLWLDGDHRARGQAEASLFVEGASVREDAIGTNAPGTALALDEPVQIVAAEHFSRVAHRWSCSAVPIHDPDTGAILGALDVTGQPQAASPQMLTTIRATVAAAEAELRINRLSSTFDGPYGRTQVATSAFAGRLEVLGRDHGRLTLGHGTVELSPRHTELMFLLVTHPSGLTAEELAISLHEWECSPITVRAEMNRLRRILGHDLIQSRPYRLSKRLDTDVQELRRSLDRGGYRRALENYRGPLLPRSQAPAIVGLRDEIRHGLREALMRDATTEVLWEYAQTPDGLDDVVVWRACRDRLPAGSQRRTRAVSHLDHLRCVLSA